MTKRSTTLLACAAAFFVSFGCGEPTAPVSAPQPLPSFQATLQEVTSTARTTGRHVVRNGNDVWVLDVSTGTVRVNGGRQARVLQRDLPRMAEIFDRFAATDRFYEALHRNPEYLRCLEEGKKNPLRRANLKVTKISQGGAPSAGLRMSSVAAVPTDGATYNTTTTPIYLNGVDCASLNAVWREQYAAHLQLKGSWFQRMGESLTLGIGEDQFPNPLSGDGPPMPSYYGYLQDLAIEAEVLFAQMKMAELAMNITQVLMASYGCITTLPPVVLDGNTPTGGGGGGGCDVHLMQFLISYDGGITWHVVAEWYEYRNCD